MQRIIDGVMSRPKTTILLAVLTFIVIFAATMAAMSA